MATAHPVSWKMTRAYAEVRSAQKHIDKAESLARDLLPGNQVAGAISALLRGLLIHFGLTDEGA
jgi:hypothetical protein